MTTTGKALDWLDEQVLAGGPGPDALIAEAAGVPPGAGGLIFLPYLAGERSPIWDPAARGAFVGLTLAHGRAHLARAVLEAAALALRHLATPIVKAGIRIDELTVSGGTARGDTWNQIKADTLQVPVAVPAVREAAVLGAAILASVGLGWHSDTLAAIRAMTRVDHHLEPNAAVRATYEELFAAYAELWPALAPTVHRLGAPRAAR
jgi:xylulokinase